MKRLFVLTLGLACLLCLSCGGGQEKALPSFKAPAAVIDLTDDAWDGPAVSYSGFRAGQRPGGPWPSDAEVLEDLRILERNWNLVRVYNADLHGEAVLRVIAAHDLDLKVLLGIYLWQTKGLAGATLAANEALNQRYIGEGLRLAAAHPDLVVGINVGNEVLVSWSFVPNDLATMIRYVRQVAAGLAAAGLDIPLTVADNYAFWESPEAPALAAELDFVTVHGYAMWDGVGSAGALDFLRQHVAAVRANLPGMPLIVGETGWATYAEDAQIYGRIGPEADEAKQATHFAQAEAWAESSGTTTIWFEAFDEPWKGEGNTGAAEGYWGLFDVNRKAKQAMHRFYPELVTDAPTSPDYAGFTYTPAMGVSLAFRASTVAELGITAAAEPLFSCTLAASPIAYEGADALRFRHDGAARGGFYSAFTPPLDLAGRRSVVFALSGLPAAAAYFELKLEGGGTGRTVNIRAYPPVRDGDWDLYTVPLDDFPGVDRTRISALGFWHPFSSAVYDEGLGHYVAVEVLIDDIRFE